MNDYRINWTQPMPALGRKIERQAPSEQDKRALELCKFEQKRHEVEVVWSAGLVFHAASAQVVSFSNFADPWLFSTDALVISWD